MSKSRSIEIESGVEMSAVSAEIRPRRSSVTAYILDLAAKLSDSVSGKH